jgi:hypothetical protein
MLSNTIKGHSMADSGMEKLPWGPSQSVPKWRYVSNGLCREGLCDNRLCQAHGQIVICSASFTTVDLVKDTYRFKCPSCRHMIEPSIVAFNNCEWKVSGAKRAHADAALEAVYQQEWQVAGNCYERLKDDPTDQTVWSSLIISTRKREPSPVVQPAALPLPHPAAAT